jgi:hypothetical protein
MTVKKISLKLVTAPSRGIALTAPPVLKASDHSVDYTCGQCGTILLHAEENAACRGESSPRRPDPLRELRIIQYDGRLGRLQLAAPFVTVIRTFGP